MKVMNVSICGQTIRADLENGDYRILYIGDYRSKEQLHELIDLALIKEGLEPLKQSKWKS